MKRAKERRKKNKKKKQKSIAVFLQRLLTADTGQWYRTKETSYHRSYHTSPLPSCLSFSIPWDRRAISTLLQDMYFCLSIISLSSRCNRRTAPRLSLQSAVVITAHNRSRSESPSSDRTFRWNSFRSKLCWQWWTVRVCVRPLQLFFFTWSFFFNKNHNGT